MVVSISIVFTRKRRKHRDHNDQMDLPIPNDLNLNRFQAKWTELEFTLQSSDYAIIYQVAASLLDKNRPQRQQRHCNFNGDVVTVAIQHAEGAGSAQVGGITCVNILWWSERIIRPIQQAS